MKLKALYINFQSEEQILEEINFALLNGKELKHKSDELLFDSLNTFNKALGQNRLSILIAISQLKPKSINELAQLTNREYPHVLNDCRKLEALGFINLVDDNNSQRKTLRPELTFNYDIIQVNSLIHEVLPISRRSNDLLSCAAISS
ncbi:hypothetical protein BIY24_01990 [Halobacteriovorax marinus]|uniref:HVO_A0114 family putative DNA-binding protein n=1 Tax=Halobacteriovorax marinus TaxID=97084 RepID=UPI000BC2E406|nr:hypothetical protein [Halobacteriovorax marinus]ATH06752.1 hypothetical protein BIY24_01990 [Halobacteriovorax marinus]